MYCGGLYFDYKLSTVYSTPSRKVLNQQKSQTECTVYSIGWVKLYQKFEIEKYTVCGKLVLPKK